MPSPEITKSRKKAIKDGKSICSSNKETYSRIILKDTIPIFLELFYYFSDFACLLQVKGDGEKPCRSERETTCSR